MKLFVLTLLIFGILCADVVRISAETAASYRGRWVEGDGDPSALEAIDAAFESTQPSAKMACLPLLYKRDWDGFVEGPPWPCWWIQNSFGPSYAMMPFLGEPYATWMEHSQGLWFRLMGDGQRKDINGFQGPDGCLCDAAAPWWDGQGGNEDIDDGTRCPPSDIQDGTEWNGGPRQDWVGEQGHGEVSLRASGAAGLRWMHRAPICSPSL